MRTDTHPSPETLVEFHAERLTEAEDRRIEEHLAECDACADVSRRVFRLSAAWDQLMTPAAGWAKVQTEPAIQGEPTWLDRLTGTLQGAALVALEGPRLTIKSCARLVERMTPPSSANINALLARHATWSFDLVLEAARGAERAPENRTIGAQSASLPSVIEAKSDQKGLFRVALDRAAKQVVVTIDRFPAEPEPLPIVKLMRRNGPTVDGSWTVRPSRGGFRDLRAVFIVHEADEYIVGTE
ncbi:MAG: zf-HC2 domain-containing protein [Vicinamibacterales bacterium]